MAVAADTTRRDTVLMALYQTDGKTFSEIGEPSSYMIRLAHEGWVVRAGTRKSAKGGRPSNVWKLSDKGRKRASGLAKKGTRA